MPHTADREETRTITGKILHEKGIENPAKSLLVILPLLLLESLVCQFVVGVVGRKLDRT
jgi:hypothetical protein